jgi:hypothetical protein
MRNETKQTAVEWLQIQLKKGIGFNPLDPLSYPKAVDDIFEQAKEMEKEQIIDSRENGLLWGVRSTNNFYYGKIIESEQWYNETYGGNK